MLQLKQTPDVHETISSHLQVSLECAQRSSIAVQHLCRESMDMKKNDVGSTYAEIVGELSSAANYLKRAQELFERINNDPTTRG